MNHFDAAGNAVMVDVSQKILTERIAVASGKIFVGAEVYRDYSAVSPVAAQSLQFGF